MTMKVNLYYSTDQYESVIQQLIGQSGPQKPVEYAVDDQGRRYNLESPDSKKFEKFVAKSSWGMTLFGDGVQYTINNMPSLGVTVSCSIAEDNGNDAAQVARDVLEHMAEARPSFGFAADEEEQFQRNRSITKTSTGTREQWLGTRPDLAIPGLYWMTLISNDLAQKHGVSLEAVAALQMSSQVYAGGEGKIFEFYTDPKAWQENAARLEEFSAKTQGIFSKRRAP